MTIQSIYCISSVCFCSCSCVVPSSLLIILHKVMRMQNICADVQSECVWSSGLPSRRTPTTGWRRWWSGTSPASTRSQRSAAAAARSVEETVGRLLFACCLTLLLDPQGLKKPYNPIIGETYRCMWLHQKTNSKTFYIAEQVAAPTYTDAFIFSSLFLFLFSLQMSLFGFFC